MRITKIIGKHFGLWLVFGLSSTIATNAIAECDVKFSDVHQVVWQGGGKGTGYDVFADDKAVQEVRFELFRTAGTAQCQIAIDITSLQGNEQLERYLVNSDFTPGLSPQQSQLKYNFFLDQSATRAWLPYSPDRSTENMILVTFGPRVEIVDNTGDTTANLVVPVVDTDDSTQKEELENEVIRQDNLVPLEKQEFIFYYTINPGQLVGPGRYTQDLTMTAYEIHATGFIPKDIQTVKAIAKVKETINIGIGKHDTYTPGMSKKYILDFGALDYGTAVSDNLNVVIRTNTNLKYEIEAENKGQLLLETGYDPALGLKHQFPYSLKINGQDNPLDTIKTYDLKIAERGILKAGIAIPLEVAIKGDLDLENYHPGTYKDTVMFTINTGD